MLHIFILTNKKIKVNKNFICKLQLDAILRPSDNKWSNQQNE